MKAILSAVVSAVLVACTLASCGDESENGNAEPSTSPGGGTGTGSGSATGGGTDNLPPTPAESGQIGVTVTSSTSFQVSWGAATDDSTEQTDLQYSVYYSHLDNIDSISDAEANGTQAMDWTAEVVSTIVSLPTSGTYYINVFVRDEDGAIAAYSAIDEVLPMSESLTISYALPTIDRRVIELSEESYRTLSVTHNGDSISCSTDGGSTWSSCASNTTAVWPTNGYNSVFKIRVNKSNAPNDGESVSLTPSALYASIDEFVTCDETVTANESFGTFEARLVEGAVVCLNDGVKITNSDASPEGSVSVSANNVTIYVKKGHTATIENLRSGNVKTFESTGSYTRLIGLSLSSSSAAEVVELAGAFGLMDDVDLVSTSASTGFGVVSIKTQSNTKAYRTSITGAGADGIRLSGVTGVSLNDVEILTVSNGVGVYADGGARFSMFECSVVSADESVTLVSNGDMNINLAVNIYESVLNSTDTTSAARGVRVQGANAGGGFLTIKDTEIQAAGGDVTSGALVIQGEYIIVDLQTVSFKRLNSGADSAAIVLFNNNGNGLVLKGNNFPNSFCKVGSINFSPVIAFDSTQTNFTLTSQSSSGSVTTCP